MRKTVRATSGDAAIARALPEVRPRLVDLRRGSGRTCHSLRFGKCCHASPEEKENDMKLTIQRSLPAALWLGVCIAWTLMSAGMSAQVFTTTTVQGTVYLANGHPGSGTLQLSWPAFTTAANQAVAAGRATVSIAS